jgi:hypothetical protein
MRQKAKTPCVGLFWGSHLPRAASMAAVLCRRAKRIGLAWGVAPPVRQLCLHVVCSRHRCGTPLKTRHNLRSNQRQTGRLSRSERNSRGWGRGGALRPRQLLAHGRATHSQSAVRGQHGGDVAVPAVTRGGWQVGRGCMGRVVETRLFAVESASVPRHPPPPQRHQDGTPQPEMMARANAHSRIATARHVVPH